MLMLLINNNNSACKNNIYFLNLFCVCTNLRPNLAMVKGIK